MESRDTQSTDSGETEQSLGFTLEPEEIDEIAEHLQGCPPCLEFIESLKTTVQMCKDIGTTERPAPLDPATHQRLLSAYQAMRSGKSPTAAKQD
ncbi:MAG: zf-HC2 domain-containing protein [Bryobacterales bacterium]|nr:zf-HC2 domain-containing protein [Bryobacterales bacterium]